MSLANFYKKMHDLGEIKSGKMEAFIRRVIHDVRLM